ncbi:hypothetical protein CAP35_06880 [Chitinophagaceae bacterium IBVUCB1]|nr:hypothetical protein CAP35_06880 [Chitinophagaceae bacterium IBVUCB1]
MKLRIGTKHKTEIPANNISEEKFLAASYETIKQLEWDIKYISKSGIIAYTPFKMSSGNEEVTIRIENDIIYIKSETLGSQLHDWGKNKKNADLFIDKYREIESILTEEGTEQALQELNSFIDSEDILSAEKYAKFEKGGGLLGIFIPREGYYVTPILIILNILVFVAMAISGVHIIAPEADDIYLWGGNYGSGTLNGQWWRIFTCAYIHIGIIHLLMNMYGLIYIGLFLEPLLGKWKFLACYILTGITSSLLSLYIHPDVVSAGASGAIFGLYGVFLAMLTTNLIDKASRKAILPSIAIFVGYNLLNGLKEGVDNAGHIGGLIGGVLLGYAYYSSIKHPDNKQTSIITTIAATILIGVSVPITFKATHNSDEAYINAAETFAKNMERFTTMESMALEIYTSPNSSSKETMLNEIQNRGIYYWKECEKILVENEKIAPNNKAREVNNVLKEYVALRIQCYELLYKKVSEETDIYDAKIQELNNKIETTISKLK